MISVSYMTNDTFLTPFLLSLQDQDDLPFRKGEVLYIINKDEEQWWTARNEKGQIGQIPVPYIQKVSDVTRNSIGTNICFLFSFRIIVVIQLNDSYLLGFLTIQVYTKVKIH